MSRHAVAAALLVLLVALADEAWALAPAAASPELGRSGSAETKAEAKPHGVQPALAAARGSLPSMCAEQPAPVSARVSARVLRELGLIDDGSVPWCITPDDARCSPMHESGSPSGAHADARLSSVAGISFSVPRPSETDAHLLAPPRGAPREAARMRLERPPRVGRQAV